MRAYRLAILAATLAFTALMLMWIVTTPPFRGVHEHENFNAVIRLEYGGGWPDNTGQQISAGVFQAMQESGLYATLPRSTAQWSTQDFADVTPPTDYSAIDASNALKPAATYVPDTAYVNPPLYFWIQATAAEAVGMQGVDWHTQLFFARLLNVFMALWIPGLVAAAARHIATKRWAAATVAFLPLGIPELAHTVTTVAPDALYITGCLALTATITLVMHHGPSLRRSAVVGIALGLTSLASFFAVFMVPLIIAGFVLARPKSKWFKDLIHTVFALGVGVAVGGIWWILGNAFGHVVVNGARSVSFVAPDQLAGGGQPGQSFLQFASEQVTKSAVSFWGSFGYFEVELNSTLAIVLTLVMFAGMGIGIGYARKYRIDSIILVGFVALLYSTFMVVLYIRYTRGVQDLGFEGRFMFIALGAGAAVVALGIAKTYAVGHVENGFPTWLPSGALAIGLFGLLTAFQGFYRPFDESLGQAFERWAMWTPGGAAVLIPAIVFLVLVIAAPIVVNLKILRPENWEDKPVASRVG